MPFFPSPPLDAAISPRPLWIGSVRVDPPVLQAPMAGFTNYAYRQIVRQLGGAWGCWPRRWSVPGASCTAMPAARRTARATLGRARRAAARWPCRSGTTIRRRWPRSAARLVEEFASAWWTSTSAARSTTCPRRPRAARTCCGTRSGLGRSWPGWSQRAGPTPVTAKIRLGCTPRHDQRHRRGPGDRRGRRGGRDRPRPHGGGPVPRRGRLGRNRADQTALETHPRDRQRRPAHCRRRGRCLPPLRRGRGDDRPGGLGPAVALPAGPSRFGRRAVPPEPTLAQAAATPLGSLSPGRGAFRAGDGTILMRRYACCYAQGRRGVRQFRAQVSLASTPEQFAAAVDRYFAAPLKLPG